jgi:hypothetical protein
MTTQNSIPVWCVIHSRKRSALEDNGMPPIPVPFNTTLKHDTKNDIPVKLCLVTNSPCQPRTRSEPSRRHGAYLIGRLFYLIV